MGEGPAPEIQLAVHHLHLHLEPGERNATPARLSRKRYNSREEFFAAHSAAAWRRRIPLTVYAKFLTDLHAEQRRQNVTYVELRLSPRRLIGGGLSWEQFLRASDDFLAATRNPVVRGILLLNRDSPKKFVSEVRDVLTDGLPPSFVGIDLAGDEIAYGDVSPFASTFSTARSHGLGVTVHAGEFGGPVGIWRAIDQLGAMRIGHGIAARRDPVLMSRLARDRILLEISITSNSALGALPPGAEHPARQFHESGIPLSFNSDVPLHTGRDLTDEIRAATALMGAVTLKEVQRTAAEHTFSAAGPAVTTKICSEWTRHADD